MMDNRFCIINIENQIISDKLKEYGYTCITTEKSDKVSEPISRHADVLYLKTGDREIYVSDCQKNNIKFLKDIGYYVFEVSLLPGYRTESKLNMVITDNTIICNPETCVKYDDFCSEKEIITVKQGYTRCSTVVLSDNNYITEDEGIYRNLKKYGKNCLLIEKGYVFLYGYDYGFIGGASIFLKNYNKLFFIGDISKHPDFSRITEFCNNINIEVEWINNMILTDIGGAVIL